MLGLRSPPCSWTGTVGPSLPEFTIAPSVHSMLWYRSIRRSKSILHDNPKVYGTYMHFAHLHIVSLLPRLVEPLVHSLELWFLYVCVCYLSIT
jgi:hypothetical protein